MCKSVRKVLVMTLGQAVKDGIKAKNPIADRGDWTVGNPTVFVPDLFQHLKASRFMGSMPPPRVRTGEPRPWLDWVASW